MLHSYTDRMGEVFRPFPPSIRPIIVVFRYQLPPDSWHLAGWVALISDLPIVGKTIVARESISFNEPLLMTRPPQVSSVNGINFQPVDWIYEHIATLEVWGIDDG